MTRLAVLALCALIWSCASPPSYVEPRPEPEIDLAQRAASGADTSPACAAELGSPVMQVPFSVRMFPEQALNAGIQGWAYVRFDVGTDGATANHAVLYSEPGEIFDEAAAKMIQNWRFAARAEPCAAVVRRVVFRLPG